MPVVVVESPAKAKTINKYLGKDFVVLASYGHVRDLPPKDGSVDTEHDFDMKWEIGVDSRKHVKAIADALKDDNNLILATDPDREGEAISWHLEEALRKRKAIKKDTPVSRVVFNAITKTAVTEAMKKPPARSMSIWLMPIWRAARWIIWWLQPVAGSVAQTTRCAQCGTCAIGLSAADCRARDGNRGLHQSGILVGQGRAFDTARARL